MRRAFHVMAAGALALSLTAIAMLGLLRVPKQTPLALSAPDPSCAEGAHGSVAGILPAPLSAGASAIVQILPASPYGNAYLDAVRQRFGLQVGHVSPLSPAQLQQLKAVIHYAPLDRRGRFKCRGLEPGRYIAVASIARADGGFACDVAAFAITLGSSPVTLSRDQFRPLKEV